MTRYLDASVIVPLVVAEPMTDAILRWLDEQDDDLAVGRLAIGEAGSAISRRRRMQQLTDAQGEAALAALDEWLAAAVTIVDHHPDDIAYAARLVRRPMPKLLMPDAIHLATCRRLEQWFVTADLGLIEVADLMQLDWISLS